MDKEYWKNYYNSQRTPGQPSLFAKFVLKNYLKENETLIELGCGNGRDSLFFARHNIRVLAIDQCENEIKNLKETNDLDNLDFECADFTKLKIDKIWKNIYSRFTLHSISSRQEDDVITWAYNSLDKNGRILIEVRGKKNELFKLGEVVKVEKDAYIYEGHYRRFIEMNNLCFKLEKVGFKILLSEEKPGFAPFGNTNYTFIRIIAEKKYI